MAKVKIFDNIAEDELEKMMECFHAKHKKFASASNLMGHRSADLRLGVLLSGEADLIRYDYEGYRNIMEHLTAGDVFGDYVNAVVGADELAVVSDKKCEVLFIDYRHVIKRCPNACSYHSTLVHNLLQIMTEKVYDLRAHLGVLSQRSLRTKLLTYFRMLAKQRDAETFTLPFTLADLADYLYIDRSAMLREMKKLREEGLIVSQGRKITLK